MPPLLPALLALGPASLAGLGAGRWRRHPPALRRSEEACVARCSGPDTGGSIGSDLPSGVGPTLTFAAVLLVAAATIAGCSSDDNAFESCEGYWAPPETCLPLGPNHPSGTPDRRNPNKNCPQWRMDPSWGGRDQFLQRLNKIEASAQDANDMLGDITQAELERRSLGKAPWVNVLSFRGLAPSRIEANKFVGNKEFLQLHSTPGMGMCWPAGYGRYYVGEHDVVPSKKFQQFVQNFDLTAFQGAAEALEKPEQPQQLRANAVEEEAERELSNLQLEQTLEPPDEYDLIP